MEPESSAENDHPAVSIHPPLFYLATLAISYVLDHLHPLPVFHTSSPRAGGLLLVIAGIAIIVAGRRLMKKHGTNINPTRPTTAIIQSGPYRFSRNPLYVSLTLVYLGAALLLNTGWPFLLLPLVLLPMHFLVVLREEHYLETKFGEVYRNYQLKVRRYF